MAWENYTYDTTSIIHRFFLERSLTRLRAATPTLLQRLRRIEYAVEQLSTVTPMNTRRATIRATGPGIALLHLHSYTVHMHAYARVLRSCSTSTRVTTTVRRIYQE